MIDQFIVAAEDKWGQRSPITMLLPHGLEGRDPSTPAPASSGTSPSRPSRTSASCIRPTAAQYFHVLRRQAIAAEKVPLICFTPKRYLRMPHTRSPLRAFTEGGFELVLDDRAAPADVRRVILCTGKIAHELMDERDQRGAAAAVVRVEQLFPWPETELLASWTTTPTPSRCGGYRRSRRTWADGPFVHDRLHRVLRDRDRTKLRHVARSPSASPASGARRCTTASNRRSSPPRSPTKCSTPHAHPFCSRNVAGRLRSVS